MNSFGEINKDRIEEVVHTPSLWADGGIEGGVGYLYAAGKYTEKVSLITDEIGQLPRKPFQRVKVGTPGDLKANWHSLFLEYDIEEKKKNFNETVYNNKSFNKQLKLKKNGKNNSCKSGTSLFKRWG